MKKILTIIAVAIAMLATGTASAQTFLTLGYAPQTIKTTGNTVDSIALNGFSVGINQNLPISGMLDVSVGLNARYSFAKKERNLNLGILGNAQATAEYSQLLLDIPVLINYSIELGTDMHVTLFAGPTVSFALAGKTTWSGNASVLGALNLGTDGEDDWYDEGSNISRFDLGGTIGVALNFAQFGVYGGYNLGLLNLSTANNTTRKASNFFIGVNYGI